VIDKAFEKDTEIGKPKGLYYFDSMIQPKMEKELIEFLDKGSKWKSLSKSPNSRKVQHYGYLYDYKSGKSNGKTDEIPKQFQFLIDVLKDNCEMLKIDSLDFNQVIVNNYESGQGISAHIDTNDYGEIIGCYTIGSGATMCFSKDDKQSKYNLYVKPKSLYIMSGESRYNWTHEMPSRKSDMVNDEQGNEKRIKRDRRISITFRFVPK
jgi:alkylated DNA repair dioxygenase AlkB